MGFFYREASSTFEWSTNTLNSIEYLSNSDIIEEVGGAYDYYCYVLADFDPIRSEEIRRHCTVEQVTKAIMARFAYNRKEDA